MGAIGRRSPARVDLGFLLTVAPAPSQTDAGHPEGSRIMPTAYTCFRRLLICVVLFCLQPSVSRGAPPATAPATQPAVVPELETRTGAFVPEDWGPLPEWASRRLVELVVKRGGAPLRVATREELWKRGRKVEAEFHSSRPYSRPGRYDSGT